MLSLLVMKAFIIPILVIWIVFTAILARLSRARKPSTEMPAPPSKTMAFATMGLDWTWVLLFLGLIALLLLWIYPQVPLTFSSQFALPFQIVGMVLLVASMFLLTGSTVK